MLNLLWVLLATNVIYIAYLAFKKVKSSQSENSLADDIKFVDVPDHLLSTTPVAKKVNLNAEATSTGDWWNQKINLPKTSSQVSRRYRKIEHDQLLLSDLDQSFK